MFGDFEWDPDNVPLAKLILHCAQILLAFVAWCLEIVVFRDDKAEINGNNGWTFGVCFLSIPAWIYLALTPRFPRTRKLAQPHAMAVIDALFTIIWLSAFATQASYNTANKCGDACSQSKAIVGLGFFVFLLFAGSTFVSLYTVHYWSQNGQLPGYDKVQMRKSKSQNIDPDKAAFSMAPHDEEAYSHVPMNDRDDPDDEPEFNAGTGGYGRASNVGTTGHGDDATEYSSAYGRPSHVSAASYADGPPMAPAMQNPFESPADYRTGQQHGATGYSRPTVQSAYGDDDSAHFPPGNYDRVQ